MNVNNEDKKIVLQANKLSKKFDEGGLVVNVLNEADLQIFSGEQVAIVGASGSGKSTLMHLLGGLDEPTAGEVIIDGKSIFKMSDKQRGNIRNSFLGFVYQFHHLLPEFTALENVAMPLLIRGTSIVEATAQSRQILDKVGLDKREGHKPGEMSGGERQRAAIARALVTKPRCILADEPTGNLDKKTAEKVYKTMLELNQELDTSFIVVTHELSLAQKMDRVLTIEDGVLVDFN